MLDSSGTQWFQRSLRLLESVHDDHCDSRDEEAQTYSLGSRSVLSYSDSQAIPVLEIIRFI